MKNFKVILSLLPIFLVGLTMNGCFNTQDSVENPFSAYVVMDVNPSVGFFYDESGVVSDVHALNQDAEVLLIDLNLEGETLEEAIGTLTDEMIEQGFLDPEDSLKDIELDVINEDLEDYEEISSQIRERVRNKLEEKHVMARVKEKSYNQEFVEEAQSYGLTPRQYRLVKQAMDANLELTFDEAKEMVLSQLSEMVKQNMGHLNDVIHDLRDEMLAEKKAIHDLYIPQIQAIETSIEEAIVNGEPTEELIAQLEQLKAAMRGELDALRAEFKQQSDALKEQVREERQNRINQFKDKVEDFVNKWRNGGSGKGK